MMIKIILLLLGLHTIMSAGFMDSVGDVVKATLSDNEKEVPKVETVGTVETLLSSETNHEEDSLLDSVADSVKDTIGLKKDKPKPKDDSLLDSMMDLDGMVDSVKDTIGLKKDKPKKKRSMIGKTVTAMKEVVGLENVEEDNSYFEEGIMADMADMIDLEKGETLGLPSVFGLNKKKKKKVFGSTILGDTILGDAKETSTTFYRGFKTSGESAEFMSGVMYKSSKMYNEMFDMFDDSPMNIFDDKDEREPSVFDMFDKGNDVLDIFE